MSTVVVPLESLLSARTVWRAGRQAASAPLGESTGFAALDALLPSGGWPQGALSELLIPVEGVGELTLLMPTIARMTQAGRLVALIAPPFCPYAPAWQRAGVDLRHLEIVDTGDHGSKGALWAFEQCLRSAAFSAVLGWPANADGPALRRLQVAADTGQCLGFAVRDSRHADNPSPAALRIERVENDWRIRKCRGGQVPSQGFAPPSHAGLRG
ncbi:translesion DNA synthesis-associated protein ImuA [Lysobacter arvi]|uniref:Translesion DNA synthesis-associated protein ImuA n=1 Tax=Lysobacter arvi TaxID=3038776 RepID=A0ABU1C9E7_9GAMM|nr:translesion DNA synthesis-associated protein ImuA [Lysobacter arvi]MDR0181720.1 translesion DNA synthesis-associated protein ImuA [Lysobacter arvi]